MPRRKDATARIEAYQSAILRSGRARDTRRPAAPRGERPHYSRAGETFSRENRRGHGGVISPAESYLVYCHRWERFPRLRLVATSHLTENYPLSLSHPRPRSAAGPTFFLASPPLLAPVAYISLRFITPRLSPRYLAAARTPEFRSRLSPDDPIPSP